MTQRDIKKIDKTILDNFYKLVHTQENVRLTAAASSFKILSTMKKTTQPDKFNENLNYTVDRLVAGLASSRALARKGYGTLLLELLRSFNISTERLFTIGQQKFGQISKETQMDELLAYFLLISIVIESGNYKRSKSNTQYLEKIYKLLTQLLNVKSYLEYPVCNLLVTHHDIFHPHMVASINPQMLGSDTKASAINLLIMVLCNKKDPIRDLLALDNSTLMNLCYALLDERFQKRPLHPVFNEVSQFIITHYPAQFEKFYNEIIHPTFFKANHNELAIMGLEYTETVLESIRGTEAIKVLLNKHLIRLLIVSLRGKSSLYTNCQKFFTSLENHFKKMQVETEEEKEIAIEKQKSILSALTTSPGSISFDEDSLSNSMSNLLQHCDSTVLEDYLQTKLISLFQKNQDKIDPHLEISCARQVAFVIRRPQMLEHHDTLLRSAKFLLFNSIFKIKRSQKDTDNSFWLSHSLPKPLRNASELSIQSFKDSYHGTLDHILSTCTAHQCFEHLYSLIDFADKLLNLKSVEYLDFKVSDQTNEIKELWTCYKDLLDKHTIKVKENSNLKQLYPITILFLFYGLQIVEHKLDCSMQLEELTTSSDDALQDSKTNGDSPGTKIVWADVLTDQIISILSASECSSWIRKLSEKVFGYLLPYITKNSVDLLCRAMENEDDEDDEDDTEDESEDESESESENESDEESDDEANDKKLDSKHIKKGNKEVCEDDNMSVEEADVKMDEDEEYLDDDRMIEMDSKLAEMFKIKRKTLNTSTLFKLRVVDLIKRFVTKKKNDTEAINSLLTSLYPLVAAEKPPLNNKIVKIINSIQGKGKYPKFFVKDEKSNAYSLISSVK